MCPLVKIILCTLILLIAPAHSGFSEQLDIIYSDRESDGEPDAYSPYLIDNQSYLKELNERRSRSTTAPPASVIIIDRSSPAHQSYRQRGIEYYDGSTMLRYNDGYHVNHRRHFYTVTPRHRAPHNKDLRRPHSLGGKRR